MKAAQAFQDEQSYSYLDDQPFMPNKSISGNVQVQLIRSRGATKNNSSAESYRSIPMKDLEPEGLNKLAYTRSLNKRFKRHDFTCSEKHQPRLQNKAHIHQSNPDYGGEKAHQRQKKIYVPLYIVDTKDPFFKPKRSKSKVNNENYTDITMTESFERRRSKFLLGNTDAKSD